MLVTGLAGWTKGRSLGESPAAAAAAHSGQVYVVRAAGDDRGERLYSLLEQADANV